MDEILYADSLKDEGNYKQAIDIYKKILLKITGLREKADINQKIELAGRYYNNAISISNSEVVFPVVSTATLRGIVLTGKISLEEKSNYSEEWVKSWEKVKRITESYLDNYLFENIKTTMVIDWGLDKYNFTVNRIPNSTIELEELGGCSVELAMFVSLLSHLLKQSIKNSFVFSGIINEDYSLERVEEIKEKADVLRIERPMIKKFIIPSQTNTTSKYFVKAGTLNDVVKMVFPAFNKTIRKRLNELGDQRISLNSYITKTKDKKEHVVVKFKHPYGLQNHYAKRVYTFLQNNYDKFINNEGTIIEGLFISYALPMLISLREITTHIPNFIACGDGAPVDDDGYASAVVIKTVNPIRASRVVGDCFEYRIISRHKS